MQIDVTTKRVVPDQLWQELCDANVPVFAVYRMAERKVRIACADYARPAVINQVVEAHVPGTYTPPVAGDVAEVATQVSQVSTQMSQHCSAPAPHAGHAAAVHLHTIGEITDLAAVLVSHENALAGKASTGTVAQLQTDLTAQADLVQDLDTVVSGKANTSEVNDALASKADLNHAHSIEQVTGLTEALEGLDETKVDLDDPRLNDSRTPTAHDHTINDVTGLQGTLDAHTNALATKVEDDDPRLTDARTPLAHSHTVANVTGLQAQLDAIAGKQSTSEKGQAGGYAALDQDGKVPSAQLPALGGGSVPAGIISMWYGLLENIPAGWALCDGTNGTPDLRGKFVKGAPAGQEPGQTGGAATHTHSDHAQLTHAGAAVGDHTYTPQGTNTGGAVSAHSGAAVADHADHTHGAGTIAVADHASHTHTYTQVPNHVHVQTVNSATTGGLSGYTPDTSSNTGVASGYSTQNPTGGVATATTNGPSATLSHSVSGNTGGASATLSHQVTQPANHTFTQPTFNGTQATLSHSVTQPNAHTIDSHSNASNEPPYLTLAYIMKL